jgi:hypothetical protein
MKQMLNTVILTLTLGMASAAQAVLINFEGNIEFHNDVIYTYFTLDNDATNVRMWTDSFKNGENFDPITALWKDSGELVDENDDNDNIDTATQTRYDSGLVFGNLSAGDYVFTIATYNNFASGTMISDGFSFDNETAIPLAVWNQPANGVDMGTFWSVWFDGVSSARSDSPSVAVSEPSAIALMSFGLFGLLASRRKSSKR